MKMKIILLTLAGGTAALLLAQQPEYQGAAPGNQNAPYLLPNDVVRTQSISPQNISPTQNISPQSISPTQHISPQNFSTNQLNRPKANGSNNHPRRLKQEALAER